MEAKEEKEPPLFRDIRRYFCEYCGIYRSKKALIRSHILLCHKEDTENQENKGDSEKSNTCEECGITLKKPAYLKQHMQCHSLERPFTCPVEDCQLNYRRKDHLTRHLLVHEGKLFTCPIKECSFKFIFQDNMKRHVKSQHNDESKSSEKQSAEHVCPEIGCGKEFKYASQLNKHAESHVKLDYTEVICTEPNCMKFFTNIQCLQSHIRTHHQYIKCNICGTQQLRKNIKRHMRTHESHVSFVRIKCTYDGCLHTFSRKSNLSQHIKAVHLDERPFICRFQECGKKFPFRHVRDNHEKTAGHVYAEGDFLQFDERVRSRPRGGRKRRPFSVETLLRKRIVPPG